MNYENQERELNLKTMMAAIMRRWRQMLILGLALAVILGGVKGWQGLQGIADADALEELRQAYEISYNSYLEQIAAQNTKILMVQEDIAQQRSYLENSVLMQIDHRNAYVATVSLYVAASGNNSAVSREQTTLADLIADAYRVSVTDSRVIDKAAESLEMEPKYLRELVRIPCEIEDERQVGPLVTVTIRGKDAESVEQMAQVLLGELDGVHQHMVEAMGEHTVSVVVNSINAQVDAELADIQEEEAERLLGYNDLLEEYQLALEAIAAPAAPDLSVGSVVKSAVKYALVGFAAGVFLIAAWGCVIFVVGDKVYSARELKNRFGMALLGSAALKKKKKCCVDRWLDRLENRENSQSEDAYALIAANIRNSCTSEGTLLIAGSAGNTAVDTLVQNIAPHLPGMKLLCGGSMLDSLAAVEGLAQCDGVVLVECCGVSRYSTVRHQIEAVQNVNKRLVGCVTLEK